MVEDDTEKRMRRLEVEVAVLRAKMNLIAYVSSACLIGVVTTLITILVKG